MKLLEKIKNGVYTIAEMSANHAGDIENALKIVRAAKDSGADCLKIQTYTADSLTIDCSNEHFLIKGGLWDGYNLYDLYEEAATPYNWQPLIVAECERVGIDFLSTPFDEDGADFLEKLGVGAYKIASFELVHIPLIRHIAKKGRPMIVSCGMGSEEEIGDAVDAMTSAGLSKEQIVLLKCTSEYPANFEDMNLLTISDMEQKFGCRIGFSDHSMGSVAAVAAVALGACVVEKHFCLSREIKNPDSEFSMEPHEFSAMVYDINFAYSARGGVCYTPGERESASMAFRRSLFAVRDIREGEPFTAQNVRVIRPGYGMKPKLLDDVLHERAASDINRGTPLDDGMVTNMPNISKNLGRTRKYRNFESARLFFREICLDDADNLVRWRSDPNIFKLLRNPTPLSLENHLKWYEDSYLNSGDRVDFIIIEKDGLSDIGFCNLTFLGQASCEIGYAIGELSSQGKGYASETVGTLIREFSNKEIGTFYATVHRDNIASIKLLEKNRFLLKEKVDNNFLFFELKKS